MSDPTFHTDWHDPRTHADLGLEIGAGGWGGRKCRRRRIKRREEIREERSERRQGRERERKEKFYPREGR